MTPLNYLGQQYPLQNQSGYNLTASATPEGAWANGVGDNINTVAKSTPECNVALASDPNSGSFAFAYDGIMGKIAQSFAGANGQNSLYPNNIGLQLPLANTVPVQGSQYPTQNTLDQQYPQLQQNFPAVTGNTANSFQPQQMMQMFQQMIQFMNYMMQIFMQMMGGMLGGKNPAYANSNGYNSGTNNTAYPNSSSSNSSSSASAYYSPQGSYASASSSSSNGSSSAAAVANSSGAASSSSCNPQSSYIQPLQSVGGSANGQALANAASRVACSRNTVGKCYRGVKDALNQVGINVSGGSAWQAANQLASNPKMREVNVSNPQDLKKLPAGAVVVWGQTNKSPHGHISVALGDGREASDHVSKQLTNLRGHTNYRVFMPA